MNRGATRLALIARLLLLVALPLAGTLYFASTRIADYIARYEAMKAAGDQVARLVAISDLVHRLQIERGLTVGFLAAGGGRAADLAQARQATDAAMDAVMDAVRGASLSRPGSASVADNAELGAALSAHANLRTAADRFQTTPTKIFAAYCVIVDKLMAIADKQVRMIDDAQLQTDGNALSAFSRAKEAAARERAILHAAFIAGHLDRQTRSQVLTLARTQELFLLQFSAMANSDTLAAYAARKIDAFREAERLRSVALDDADGRLRLGPERWFSAATAKIDAMKEIEEAMARDTRRKATASVDQARSEAAWNLALCVLIVVVTLILVAALFGVVQLRPAPAGGERAAGEQ